MLVPNHSVRIRDLTLTYGAITVLRDLNLDIHDGEFLVLLGSSGCGKSTLLNCIAGLLEPTDGQIFIKGRNVTWLEPSERGIGMVFQSYALYPQMTVRGNLSFGLKNARMAQAEIEARVAKAARILQIEPLLDRKPAALSGGQRQRVAIGRALVRDVDVFLFDEPLSNLDAKLRADLRVEIKRLHQDLDNTMIYVTHDQVEAMTLADRIAIMRSGKVMQLGTPDEIYNRPQSKYVADFIGSPSMNFLDGHYERGTFRAEGFQIDMAGYQLGAPQVADRPAILGIRPEHVATGALVNAAPIKGEVTVDLVEPMGADTLVWAQVAGKPFRIRMDGQARVVRGDRLTIGIDPSKASMFDAKTEERL
ncbi:ABC transporter ATP-binding protein [Rubellimicrobium roseum]|uniref:ABC transporter ATP-binding protein n=1 Tax=Rubellimicrobium roseum TaxID=687525 RepID=A0A5C4NN91_9RHOB|nr:ABC transporter ATP-binding protein [Rubellimicrobium roseum]TNC74127.1 ABC transporter ATP-binding protein [Rubellimicrobium roseum]